MTKIPLNIKDNSRMLVKMGVKREPIESDKFIFPGQPRFKVYLKLIRFVGFFIFINGIIYFCYYYF